MRSSAWQPRRFRKRRRSASTANSTTRSGRRFPRSRISGSATRAKGRRRPFQTEARIAYDATALYVAVQAFDPEPQRIVGIRTRRDEDSPSDWISVLVDSFHDRRTAFEFAVNPAGVKQDRYWFNDTNNDQAGTRCGTWRCRATSDGWRAEFRIPFSQLRFNPSETLHVRLRGRPQDRPAERDVDLAAAVEERQRLRVVVRRAHRPARSRRRSGSSSCRTPSASVTTQPAEPGNPLLERDRSGRIARRRPEVRADARASR